MKFVNCTPHDIVIFDAEGTKEIARFPAEKGREARVDEQDVNHGTLNGIEVKQRSYDKIIGLPEPDEDTYYIVSMIVLLANEILEPPYWRNDLISPDTGNGAVRNEKGMIVGTKNFVCL